jgi:hypothetical protein
MYTTFDSVIRNQEKFSSIQHPLIVTVSSEADWATKRAFPLGQWLEGARSEDEMRTLGHFNPYLTHELVEVGPRECIGSEATISESFGAEGLCLRRTKREIQQQYNPFIVTRTPAGVIKDHNDIWNSRFQLWLLSLMEAIEDSSKHLQSASQNVDLLGPPPSGSRGRTR